MSSARTSIVNSTRIETLPGYSEQTPILLLPGLFGGSWIWQDVAAGLSQRGHRVSMLSEPLGLNSLIKDPPKLVTWATELVESMYDEPVVIAGNSMGALICMEMAAQRTDLLKAVVLSGAPGLGERIQPPDDLIQSRGKDFAMEQAKRLFWNKELLTPELADRVYDAFYGANPKQKLAILRGVRATKGYDARSLFPRIAVPTLLVWGDEDEISPDDEWASAVPLFPNAQYVGIPEAGHSPMLEQPALFLSALMQFLETCGVRKPPVHAGFTAPRSEGAGFAIVCDLVRQRSVAASTLTPETLLSEIGLDSLGALELMLTCENQFGVTLLSDDTPELRTVGEAGAFLDERLKLREAS